jgi:hypothetical protein
LGVAFGSGSIRDESVPGLFMIVTLTELPLTLESANTSHFGDSLAIE